MNKIKKLYRDFFGLNEQTSMTGKPDPSKDVVLSPADSKDPKKVQAAQNILKTTKGRIHIEEELEIDEATLDNSITEYQGGVQWIVTDPATAKHVMQDISQWATKKGFNIIKRKISNSGRVGYIYFRLGQDPSKEAQRIQGYVSQTPEIKQFRFKVLGK